MLSTHSLQLQRMQDMQQGNSIEFKAGQFWCLLGPNGSGKSTFLQSLAGLLRPSSGEIHLQGQKLSQLKAKQRAQKIGMLLQESETCLVSTVAECLEAARYPHNSEQKGLIDNLLKEFELWQLRHKKASDLSGGEQQRVHIAMLMAQQPEIYLLDEPCNHLDPKHQIQVLSHLQNLAKQENKLVICALHDINLAYQFADHGCLFFKSGQIKSGKIGEIFTETDLSLLYTLPLIRIKTELQSFWTYATPSGS